jgi:hypothetical protein
MEVTLHGFRIDRKKKMDCKQVQSGIIDFINDNMDIKEMEQFIILKILPPTLLREPLPQNK